MNGNVFTQRDYENIPRFHARKNKANFLAFSVQRTALGLGKGT